MISPHDAIASALRNGILQVDEKEGKLRSPWGNREVAVVDETEKKLEMVADKPSTLVKQGIKKAFSIYKRDVVPHNEQIKLIKREMFEATDRKKENVAVDNVDTEFKTSEELALNSLSEYKRIADILPSEHLPAYLANVEYADDLLYHVMQRRSNKNGLKVFIDKLVSAKKDISISKLPPEKYTIAQNEFIRLSQQQIPKAYQHNITRSLARAEGGSKEYLTNEIKPLVDQIAINCTFNPKQLFPNQINKGQLCHFIENSTLIQKNGSKYFIDKDKKNPMTWDKTTDTFKQCSIQEACENFSLYEREYSHYINAKQYIKESGAGAADKKVEEEAIPDFDTMVEEEKYWQKRKDEQLSALSCEMGKKLREGNPAITDLSDSNRPMKLSEQFNEIYDNNWTDCMEELSATKGYKDRQGAQLLMDVVADSYDMSKKFSQNHLLDSLRKTSEAENLTTKQINSYLTQWSEWLRFITLPEEEQENIKEISDAIKSKYKSEDGSDLSIFIDKVASHTYNMIKQTPPCEFLIAKKGDEFNKDYYREFTQSGNTVDYPVWPCFLLHENGPTLSKGVCQAVKK